MAAGPSPGRTKKSAPDTPPPMGEPRGAGAAARRIADAGNLATKGPGVRIPPTRMVDIELLIPYINNARTHSEDQIKLIAASIEKFGWTVPVLTDGKNGIIAGHGRVMAARLLGLKMVPIIELRGMSDADKRAYVLADNKLAERAGWDSELLAIELGRLREEKYDLSIIGFSGDELAKLFGEAAAPDDFPGFDSDIETEHTCPKCGYKFSGGDKATREAGKT